MPFLRFTEEETGTSWSTDFGEVASTERRPLLSFLGIMVEAAVEVMAVPHKPPPTPPSLPVRVDEVWVGEIRMSSDAGESASSSSSC